MDLKFAKAQDRFDNYKFMYQCVPPPPLTNTTRPARSTRQPAGAGRRNDWVAAKDSAADALFLSIPPERGSNPHSTAPTEVKR